MPTTRMTGGGALVEMLKRHGVDTLFALPGVQNDALFVALYDANDTIRVIHTRHEQAAAYMALGYARASGRPGAYAVVPGPGCSTPPPRSPPPGRPTRRCYASAARSRPT
jgi:acetolactate synthase-1/2/3 large subunit